MSGDLQHKEFSREEISQAAQELGFELPNTAEDCMNEAVGHINSAVVSMVKAGLVLMKARAEGLHMNFRLPIPAPDKEDDETEVFSARAEKTLPEEKDLGGRPPNDYFRAALEKCGIPFQRAYECMQMAGGYLRAPEDIRARLLKTGKRKALMLTSLDPETLGQLSTEEWDDYSGMSLRMLRVKLRESEKVRTALAERLAAEPAKKVPYASVHDSGADLKCRRYTNMAHEWGINAVLTAGQALEASAGCADPETRYKNTVYLASVLMRILEETRTQLSRVHQFTDGRPVGPEDLIIPFTAAEKKLLLEDGRLIQKDIENRRNSTPKKLPPKPYTAELPVKTAAPKDMQWECATQKARETARLRSLFLNEIVFAAEKRLGTFSGAVKEITARGILFKGKPVKRSTLHNWAEAYRRNGICGLLPQHRGRAEKIYGWEEHALMLYNIPGAPTYAAVAKMLEAVHGFRNVSPDAVKHFIKNKVPAGKGDLSPERTGKHSFKLNQTPYIRRSTQNMNAGDYWMADGHRLDIYLLPEGGDKVKRYELIVWMDIKSRFITGWKTAEHESATAVLESFAEAVRNTGHVPPGIYVDNGCGYKARIMTDEHTGAYTRLGVKDVIFALPGNARAKGQAERFFRTLEEHLNVFLTGYCGYRASKEVCAAFIRLNDPDRRRKGQLPPRNMEPLTLPRWEEIFARWLQGYHRRQHPEYRNRTIEQVWAEVRRIDPVMTPAEMKRPQEMRTVVRGSVRHDGREYAARVLADYNGRQVSVEFDYDTDSAVIIRTASGKFICRAELVKVKDFIPSSRREQKMKEALQGKLRRLQNKADDVLAASGLTVHAGAVINNMPDVIPENSDEEDIKIDLNDF
ncbi:hypothetical protein CHS0354_006806 [Potamilus streckersoni]|uniref:Integrase catalytic domain-containing protein n=1 Tax=Potamilus streckersoni TaxID=2493646 RepID=A0AAE0TE67_9BIVA|nr:hypothetical protein CHS0354_006806 [Potamilus streckersoni]